MERGTVLVFLLVSCLVLTAAANGAQQAHSRKKRQIMQDQPRLLTENGDLVFQCGNNKNIHLRPSPGGGVYLGSDNLTYIAEMAKGNRDEIMRLKSSTETPANVENRLNSLETSVSALQSVPGNLQTLTTSFNTVKTTVENTNANNRLLSVENRLDNLSPTGQVQTSLTSLNSRLTSLENTVRAFNTSIRQEGAQLQQRVQQLENTVQNLQNLLTVNECHSNPCNHGGTCVDRYNGFFCQCRQGWKGTTCSEDVDECVEYRGTDKGCQNGATCQNLQGSFRCQCAPNWFGILCTSPQNDCSGASDQELCGHGTCHNLHNTQQGQANYRCDCDMGWTNNPNTSDPSCDTDIDECTSRTYPAHCSTNPQVRCINYPGGYTCGDCPTGYSGDGFTCTDINECETNNGGCSISPRVDCYNTIGSRTCGECPPGYQGNGQTCTYVGLCNANNGGCHPLATCTETSGVLGVTCTCPANYIGSGRGPSGCVQQGSGACASNPCLHGTCSLSGTSYTCSCQAGFTGQNCDSDINECLNNNPCQNGGTCVNNVGSFTCSCTSDYTGPTCTEPQQGCGGYLSGESGSFSYPTVQGTNYSHSVSCAWRITTTTNKILMITFPRFSVEYHVSCDYDFLQIHDGPSASSHMIGKYCGTSAPNGGHINSTHNQLYFWFKSDASIASDGFTVSWTSADPVCGGILNGTYGTIQSPGYPGNYPHNRDCVWVVSVPLQHNILLTFATFALENHPNCSYDYLQIRAGETEDSPLVNTYCNSSGSHAPLTIEGPYAYLHFHSDSSLSARGFMITYAAQQASGGCGGALSGTSGVITSPGYPNPYNHNAECVWTITVPSPDNVILSFTAFNLEAASGCAYDYLMIRDGSDQTAPSLGKLCGSTFPSNISSTGNVMYVQFHTDSSISGGGFRANWAAACGGVFTAQQGVLTSPSFPNAYPHNKVCTYLINQPAGYIISLTFTNFSIEGGSCSYDYVDIYDGSNTQAPRLGQRYCGSTVPSIQLSTSNTMFIRFKTDGSISNTGFRATYTASIAGCGGVLNSAQGTITSPGHPNTYPHGVNCTWFIEVAAGNIIELSFSAFRLEGGSCSYDYVEIYDGYLGQQQNATRIGSRYCGQTAPPPVTSSSNYLTVRFRSDGSVAYQGFSASYTSQNASTACGRRLHSSTGVITSPNYPNNYPDDRNCTWTITVPARQQISLNFTAFTLEDHSSCFFDYLEIRNGGFSDSPLVGRFCGQTVDNPILSHSNRMWLRFVSDSFLSYTGFRLVYDGTTTGCGGDLTTPRGSIVSPNYPNPYDHNSECFWTISVSAGSTINIVFEDFDLEGSSSCYYDYLVFRENNAQGRQIGGKVCGRSIPAPINTTASTVWIQYRTDGSVNGRGFLLSYSTGCNNVLTAPNGAIESPNYPDRYNSGSNCSWLIQTTQGNTISMAFATFDLETHSSCRYDYVQLLDGSSAGSTSLGRFCGNTIPSPLNSTSNAVRVNFITDTSITGNGFRLEYTINGCGGALYGGSGTIQSPNYPNSYDHARTCEWIITVNTSNSIQLTFQDFDMETSQGCRYDAVEVYSGSDDTGTLLTTLCHTSTSSQTVPLSVGNVMFIRMRTDGSVSGRGFRATWQQHSGGCGGNISIPSGAITSLNYPNNYPHNSECEWLFTMTPGSMVILNFTDFDIEGGSCSYDYVDVYDGPTTSNRRMARLCGRSLPENATFRASSNLMKVKMRTDSSVTGRGFRAQFWTGCGGVLDASTDGELTSPNYPSDYPPYSNCSWLISSSHTSDRIMLTFTHMDIETTSGCRDDYVRVLSGDDASAPELGRYCGTTVPQPITSTGSSMYVIFNSDFLIQDTGFRAIYTTSTSSCGGDFTSASGAFVSPNYPNSYPPSTECVWTFTASPGSRMALTFSSFNLQSSSGCVNDYLEVREGNSTGPLQGRYCGSTAPNNLTAANKLWVKFRSDSLTTGQGFQASWTEGYGGNLYADSGQLTSPNYPNNYQNNLNVVWVITVSEGSRVRLTFSSINLETSSTGCYDYVRLRDGGLASSAQIGQYCGTTPPSPIVSTTNVVRVEFITDISITRSGFQLNWQATTEPPLILTTPAPNSTVSGCGGNLEAGPFDQYLQSPGYPNGYQNNMRCVWTIRAPGNNRVWANITYIDLESHSSCGYDTLTITTGSSGSYPISNSYCGRQGNTAPIISSGDTLIVNFTTDGSITRSGFRLLFKSACGGTIQGSSTGVIHSPGYPSSYPANTNCTWTVGMSSGRTVGVRFNGTFGIPSNSGCTADYVMLLNGGSTTSPPLLPNGTSTASSGRYCGTTPPAAMETSSNSLTVVFRSDSSGSGPGFSIIFSEITVTCGGSLQLTSSVSSGYIMSPNYPQNYPHNVDCAWVITAPANERVQLDFVESFNIESHSQCNWDYVEMRDGGTVTSPSLAKVCGNTHPSTVYSTGNVMYVRFRTDSSVARTGFKAQYSIATCGGRISSQSGTILSSNFPNNYNPNSNCTWLVIGPTGHYLTFTFNAFNLESSPNCANDYVQVREYNATGNQVLQPSCGSTAPAPFDTSDSFAYVTFISNGNLQYSGFNLTFQASVEACGGDFNQPTGSFNSPNYPGQYAHSRECVWSITVQRGRRVKLTFNDLALESSSTCSWDYVQVYNGIIDESPSLGKYCGTTIPSPVESSGNTMRVRFRTDGSISNRGFRATFTSEDDATCGGIVSLPTNITSPGYYLHGNYSNNEQCIWQVENPQRTNSSIKVVVNAMALEPHSSCGYDFLEFREGSDVSAPILEKFCGNNTIPPPVLSPSDELWVRFRSDQSIVNTGFSVSFLQNPCGGVVGGPQGVITSPNYPANYDHRSSCIWKISAPQGQQIRINFTDFDLENHPTCNYDYVDIQNGGLPSSPSIGRYCTNTPPAFLSQSNEVRLQLITDVSQSGRGFRLTYSFDSEGCGGLFHANDGSFSSPNFPANYPANTECVWDINVAAGYTVILSVNSSFSLQSSSGCTNDYVEVSNVLANGTRVVVGRYCGNTAPPVITADNSRLLVKFHSDGTSSSSGFTASWTTGCGGTFTGDSGVVMSPGYPTQYANLLRCNYTIIGDPQHYVVLSFDSNPYGLENPSGERCVYDYVQVFAGSDASSRELGKFCGSTVPQTLSSLGSMYIRFWTDGSITNVGFKARYSMSECGGVFTQQSGDLQTPTYPSSYAHNSNCTWTITVDSANIVALKFHGFNLETSSNCRYDHLSVYDGDSLSSPLLARLCGTSLPSNIKSTSNKMLVNFVTDVSVSGEGFSASYWATYGPAHGCGGFLNQSSGVIRSVDPNGDGSYENNLDCSWTIFVSENKVITFNFTSLQVENGGSNCNYDYVAIYDGMTTSDEQLAKVCSNGVATIPVTTTSNAALVVFHTDNSVTRAGFNLTFTQQDMVCGGALTASSTPQNISSPNYPNPYGQGVRCRWSIDSGSDSRQVALTVFDLSIASGSTCPTEYLQFRDRPLGVYGQTLTYCGSTIPPIFDSVGRLADIIYHLPGPSSSTGFRLSYAWANCNRDYTGVNGRITSPGYPGNYPTNANCQISLSAPAGHTLALYFTSFYIEPHTSCRYDHLDVRAGTNSSSPLLAKLCGPTIPDPVYINSSSALLTFTTDTSIQHSGYDISYVATTAGLGCGGVLYAGVNGSFTSPNFPGNFSDNATCTWNVMVPARRQVHLDFTYLAVVGQADCQHNYLEVFNGPTTLSPTMGRFCNSQPSTLITSANSATVTLVSTGSSAAPSFRIVYYS